MEPDQPPPRPRDADVPPKPLDPLPDSTIEALLAAPPPRTRITQRLWEPPAVEELQRMLPQFRIDGLIGRGGMGAVYKGWQKSLDRHVAIKVLPAEVERGDAGFADRFKREAKAMARLSHPSIVAVHDAGETPDGLLYFVMDFVEGTDVQQMVAARGRLPLEEALSITARVCDALAYAHGKGIIHRDIKPSNVMVDPAGEVKVADFGLAKITSADSALLTASDVALGTPDFMAPESLLGTAQVDHRADLYAVGVMLYQMLTGKLPRGRFDPPSRAVTGLDKRLDGIIDRALQNERDARYSSAVELRSALEPVLNRTVARRTAATASAQRSWKMPALLGSLAVVLAVVAFLALRPSPPAAKNPALAGRAAQPAAPAIPAPQWQRFEFAKLPVHEATQGRKDVQMQGDLLHVRNSDGWRYENNKDLQNVAVRAVIDRSTPPAFPKLIFRERSGAGGHYFAKLTSDGVVVGTHTGGDRTIKKLPLPLSTQSPREVTLHAALIGTRMIVWLNAERLGEVDGFPADTRGRPGVQASDAFFRSVEVLELDGLPEAEARKLVGVDASNAGAGAPYPPVTAAGLISYPAGVWTRLWPAESEPTRFARRNGEWGLLHETYPPSGRVFKRAPMLNVGLRARFRGQRIKADTYPQMNLRVQEGDGGSVNLYIDPAGQKLRLRTAVKAGITTLAEVPLREPLVAGKEYLMEFYTLGTTLVGRVNGQTVTAGTTDPPIPGQLALNQGHNDFLRDVEVLNLDGLPEAEAQRLLGLEAVPGARQPPVAAPHWQDVTDAVLALPETQRLDAGWARCMRAFVFLGNDFRARSYGIRAEFRGDLPDTHHSWPQLHLEDRSSKTSFQLFIPEPEGKVMRIRRGLQNGYQDLGGAGFARRLDRGVPYTMEIYAIGSTIYARCHGQTAKVSPPDQTPDRVSRPGIYNLKADAFRKLELIHLDALPEAEALKLLGLDKP